MDRLKPIRRKPIPRSRSTNRENRIARKTMKNSKKIKIDKIRSIVKIKNSILLSPSSRGRLNASSIALNKSNISKMTYKFPSKINKFSAIRVTEGSSKSIDYKNRSNNGLFNPHSKSTISNIRENKSKLYKKLQEKMQEMEDNPDDSQKRLPKNFFLKKKNQKKKSKENLNLKKAERKFLSYLDYFKVMIKSEASDFDYIDHVEKIFNLFIEAYFPDASAKVLRDIDPTIDIRLMYEFMNHELTQDIDHYVSGYARKLMMNYFEKFFVQAKEVLLFVTQTNSAKFFDALRKKDKRIQLLEGRLAKLAEENQETKLQLIKLEKANA